MRARGQNKVEERLKVYEQTGTASIASTADNANSNLFNADKGDTQSELELPSQHSPHMQV